MMATESTEMDAVPLAKLRLAIHVRVEALLLETPALTSAETALIQADFHVRTVTSMMETVALALA